MSFDSEVRKRGRRIIMRTSQSGTPEGSHDFAADQHPDHRVVGAILLWAIDRFVRDGRLANLLKIVVVLICLAAILQRLLPMLGVGF